MLTFLLYTIFFAIASACFIKVMYTSIQPSQWLDKLFGWQKMLQRLDQKGSLLVKPLGYCELCFSHLLAVISFWGYLITMKTFLGIWVSQSIHNWLLWFLVNFTWYVLYISFTTIAGLYCITKLFAK